MFTKSLLEAQRDLEQRSQAEGYARFNKQQESTRVNEGPYATVEATKVIRGCIPLVSSEITAWREERKVRKGKTHKALSILNRFDADTLAFIALNQVFTGVMSHHVLPKVMVHIGTVLEGEVIAQEIEAAQEKKRDFARIKAQVSKQGSKRNRAKVLKKFQKEHVPEHVAWANDFKAKVGEPLVHCLLKALPTIFELATLRSKLKRTETFVRLTPEGTELLSNLREAIAWGQPIHRPMVVIPRRWEGLTTGCYYDEKATRNVRLVRTFNADHRRLINQAARDGSLDHVLEAVNHIQETPWAINKPILDIIEHCWEKGIDIPGLPVSSLAPLPPRMPQEQYEAMSDFEKKGFKINIGQLREKNRGIVAARAVMLRDLETAKELARYDRFYLPHNLDFRGRVYPVCHFSHQRADHVKAMFRFADGCPYGEFGAAWASVHLANCGDFGKVSKASFDERLQWVEDNEEAILAVGSDPLGTLDWWRNADKPFSFLAACLEYAVWSQSVRHGVAGGAYVGCLPVALDGSNSGLQHYSAALRAEDEAKLVGLVPGEQPCDLYETVAEDVRRRVKADAGGGADRSREVGISRSLVKRNVMTFAYSSAQYGFRQQLLEDTMGPLNDDVLMGKAEANPWSLPREDGTQDGGFAMSGYLAGHIYRSVTSIVKKATEGMEFFKKVAQVLAQHDKALIWTSPVGLPIVHKYSEWDTKEVHLFLYDKAVAVTEAKSWDQLTDDGTGVIRRVQANIRTRPLETLDRDKQRSAVSPNVIHSMDGAHLMLTVLDAKDAGIESLALIHDSFGTHAGRTAEFSQIIRQALVNMYENYCPFEMVLEAARSVLEPRYHSQLPEVPEKGSLRLETILEADYAFA